jgi:hypothetical protein
MAAILLVVFVLVLAGTDTTFVWLLHILAFCAIIVIFFHLPNAGQKSNFRVI